MKLRQLQIATPMSVIVLAMLTIIGCAQKGTSTASSLSSSASVGDPSGWWCPEHGVPEEECSMCSTKAAAEFKKKGDWCKEHNRAESQCFVCDPSRAEKYVALYEAKFGKKPPTPKE